MRTWLLSGLLLATPLRAAEPMTVTLDVPGMYCVLCKASVKKVLGRVPGVVEAKADHATKSAEVRFDPERISAAGLAAALTKSGYAATVREARR